MSGLPPSPDGGAPAQRAFGLLLFEAEEELARGQGDKALVLASRAVKERPDSLTALALYERARRDVLRGRRREKLEARIALGQTLLEAGRFDEAERIVNSALKLLPDHPLARALHEKLRARRQGEHSVEAEAQRELERLGRTRAQQSVRQARAALANGWHRQALAAARRGLRLDPDEPELLAVLREVQRSDARLEQEAGRRRAVQHRLRVAHHHFVQGRLAESLEVLRSVLREEPDDTRVHAAVQHVRLAWLRAKAARPEAPAPAPPLATPPPPAAPRTPPPVRDAAPPPARTPPPVRAPAAPAARAAAPTARAEPRAAGRTVPGLHVQRPEGIPQEILLPRTRRRATPLVLVLGGAAVALALVYLLVGSGGGAARTLPLPLPPPSTLVVAAPPTTASAPGPLDAAEPALRQAIESVLEAYGAALEARDDGRLARARPDLSPGQRAALLAPLAGAINVGIDVRVLDVTVSGGAAAVPVLRTAVVVGGGASRSTPVEETLRFRRRAEGWVLDAGLR